MMNPKKSHYPTSGWRFGTMEFYGFPFSWDWNVIIPTDFHSIIFQRGGVAQPPTRIDSIWILLDTTWTQQKYTYSTY